MIKTWGWLVINIYPVSDLRNSYPKVEAAVKESGSPAFLTKNGHGSMFLMSLEQYEVMVRAVATVNGNAILDGIIQGLPTSQTLEELAAQPRPSYPGPIDMTDEEADAFFAEIGR